MENYFYLCGRYPDRNCIPHIHIYENYLFFVSSSYQNQTIPEQIRNNLYLNV